MCCVVKLRLRGEVEFDIEKVRFLSLNNGTQRACMRKEQTSDLFMLRFCGSALYNM
jgi:hypothetical protein